MPDARDARWFTNFQLRSIIFLLLGLVLISLHSLVRPWPHAADFTIGLGLAFLLYAFAALLIGFRIRTFDKSPQDDSQGDTDPDIARTWDAVLGFLLVGVAGIIVFAGSIATYQTFWKDLARGSSAGVLIGAAFLSLGGLFGFLFGIPRSLRKAREKSTPPPAAAPPPNPNQAPMFNESSPPLSIYDPNTNLEEISDWLTKIIVGLGLINLEKVPGYLTRLSGFFAENCGMSSYRSIVLAIIVFFFIGGFFLCYLLTRLYLGGAFTRADLGFQSAEQHAKRSLIGFSAAISFTSDARNLTNQGGEEKLRKAVQILNQVLLDTPTYINAYIEKGRALKRLDELNGALLAVETGMQVNPNDTRLLYNRACYQALLGKPKKEVLGSLGNAIKLDPKFRAIAAQDMDFASLKGDEEFKNLIQEPGISS